MIEIRPLTTMAACLEAEIVQKQAWTIGDEEVVPAHLLHSLQHVGAAVLGAYDGEQMVGMSLGVIGTVASLDTRIDPVAAARLQMYSALTGVSPAYHGQGVGYQLKLAQRDFAMRIGIRLITWTYDPLESANGRFNIGKLGAVCHRYLPNYYGELSGINAGLPTDRFEVDWWITTSRVKGRVNQVKRPLGLNALLGGGALLLNAATFNRSGLPEPSSNIVTQAGNLMLVEIPADIQQIKEQDFDLAIKWRNHTRFLFERLFADNYAVTDFVREQDENGREHSYYLLTYQDA